MKIKDLLKQEKVTFSCEIFPPKKDGDFHEVFRVVNRISELGVDFISVTYGAGGSTSKRTVEVASYIQNICHTTALAHLTCIDSDPEQIQEQLLELHTNGVNNIMALRGDRPKDFTGTSHYLHAIDLVREIQASKDFCIGAACYPEGHMECVHKQDDLTYLKAKVDAGVDFLTTQMFFDNNLLYNFLYRSYAAGITVPIIPGIMPIINARQVKRSIELSGSTMPARFLAIADKFADNPQAMEQAGIAYATDQIVDLVANGVKHIHLYTMNRPQTAEKILGNLSCILR
ncbi:methylenetetrahydrofolate reductase [NAD(P)H] [Acutalibacter caecimuris]|uniref:methylenetetrahydrofolate reductase [NAD(P)H] n=1 Tax=Acutalibacter caecimuris TaxID=3093657 RepID=UPI002AC99890|nr:methylenetetrahydrofolate reductase [NAD(P)H] [Acutalibacter sp. M00118]